MPRAQPGVVQKIYILMKYLNKHLKFTLAAQPLPKTNICCLCFDWQQGGN